MNGPQEIHDPVYTAKDAGFTPVSELKVGLCYQRIDNGWKYRDSNGVTFYFYDNDLDPAQEIGKLTDRTDNIEKYLEVVQGHIENLPQMAQTIENLKKTVTYLQSKVTNLQSWGIMRCDTPPNVCHRCGVEIMGPAAAR